MESYKKNVEVRWADLDPNFHLRHSVYYDYGASARIGFLQQHGITTALMQERGFGLIIFREECLFKKEIQLKDAVSIDMMLLKATANFSRWSVKHTIYKNETIVSAVLTLDGAWIDIAKRKLTIPPAEIADAFNQMPKDPQFSWM